MNGGFDKKKIGVIIGAIVVGIIAIVVIALMNIIPKIGKIEVHVAYAPFIASVKINDKEVKNNSNIYLEPGEYAVYVSLDGFSSINESVVVDDENNILYGSIVAQTEDANRIADGHIDDYYAVEGYASQAISKESEKMRAEWPIIKVLPIKNSLYKVGYIINNNNDVVVTIDTVNTYIDVAVGKLKDAADGVDNLANYDIQISGFDNVLNGNFVENDANAPDEYIKNGFLNVQGFEFVDGNYEDNYYIAKVKTGDIRRASVATYVMIIKSDGGKWKFVSTPSQIMTRYNTTNVPIEVLDAANNL